ncbi:MAG: DUF3854 domain-containing protein [Aulosira sp. DedQUE10]|nr:DUF3854 domain-containing protein [Aulosira sp. DedQUE10]
MAVITDLFSRIIGYDTDVTALASERDIPAKWIEENCLNANRDLEGKPKKGWLIGRNSYSQQFKPHEPRKDSKGKHIKYESPSGKPPDLFIVSIPNGEFNPYIAHSNSRIITEGHFKAIKSVSEGLPVVSVAGVWNGRTKVKSRGEEEKVLIPLLHHQIRLGIKQFIIAFDADCASNPSVHMASIELAKLIEKEGGECKIATGQWKESEGKGMDDFISKNGVEEMRTRLEKALTLDQYIERFNVDKKSSKGKTNAGTIADELATEFKDQFAFNTVTKAWLQYSDGIWSQVQDEVVKSSVRSTIKSSFSDVECVDSRLVNNVTETIKLELLWEGSTTWNDGIPFLNGVLRDGTLEAHSPDKRLTWCLPRNYDSSSSDWDTIDRWLDNTVETEADKEVLNCFASACLKWKGNSLNKYLHLMGAHGAGKGTFSNLLEQLIGKENSRSPRLPDFCEGRFGSASAYNKRLVIFRDVHKFYGNAGNLLNLVTGETITAEEKHKDPFDFRYEGQCLITSNDPVFYGDNQQAVRRREIIVPMNRAIPDHLQDVDLIDKLVAELPAWTNYLLSIPDEHIKKILKSNSTDQQRRQMEIAMDSDALVAWMSECLDFDGIESRERIVGTKKLGKGEMSFWDATTLYDSYSLYCDVTGRDNKLNSQNFSVKLLKQASSVFGIKHVIKGKDRNGAYIQGVQLRNSPKPCDDPSDRCDDPVTASVTTLNPYAVSSVTTVTAHDSTFITQGDSISIEEEALMNFPHTKKVEKSRHSRHNVDTVSLEVVTKPSPGRHQAVTIPVEINNKIVQWEVFKPNQGDRVEFLCNSGCFQAGDKGIITRVSGENIYLERQEKNAKTQKSEVVEKAVSKFKVKFIGRD